MGGMLGCAGFVDVFCEDEVVVVGGGVEELPTGAAIAPVCALIRRSPYAAAGGRQIDDVWVGFRPADTVHATRERIPSINILRHEDLSLDPVSGYARAYESLGLAYTAQVQETIRNSSSSENPVELSSRKTHSVKLDSRANLENWKKRLAPDEIKRVRALTEDVASLFYADVKWD